MEFYGRAEKMRRPIVKQCHTDGLLLADKSRVFAPVFDDLACSYKNEGSILFTRSILLLSKVAVFPATVIRVSYEAARISPVSLGFQPRNRNRGSGVDDPSSLVTGLQSARASLSPRLAKESATPSLYSPLNRSG